MKLRFKGVGPNPDNVIYAVVADGGPLHLVNQNNERVDLFYITNDAAALTFKVEDIIDKNAIERGALPNGSLSIAARREILEALKSTSSKIEWSAL